MIIQSDNLAALKAILSGYKDRVDRMCKDSTYNTGEEKRVHDDNANDHAMHDGYDGVDKSELFAGIYQWLLDRGEDPMPRRVFERTLRSLGELKVIRCAGDNVVLKELVLLRR